ncbi:MAG: DUF4097 family beta strand repeat protein [Candidatus Bathyarchaeota archaeon]|nr:MAG: DUF4097 family beta strand repeat protein [Candidatus Bathyarchaeota archaeon]
MVYCSKCGEEIPEDSHFCSKCGSMTEKGEEAGTSYPRLGRYWCCSNEGPSRYIAEDEKHFGGLVTADKVFFEVENVNGPVRVLTWDKAEYGVELLIKAGGYTEDEAEENLKDLKVDLEEQTVQGQQRLSLKFDRPKDRRWYSIDVNVTLPTDAETDLDIYSKNGAISLANLKGSEMAATTKNGRMMLDGISAKRIDCKTSNGKMILEKVTSESIDCRTSNGKMVLDNVTAEKITGRTSNGRIEGQIESKDAVLTSSNGKIDLALLCGASGEFRLRTSNGRIVLDVSDSPDVGYDLDLSTSMNRIDVDLPDLTYEKYRRTHLAAKTQGFEEKDVKIVIEADTSMGKIQINS